jgi:hypothetical protein
MSNVPNGSTTIGQGENVTLLLLPSNHGLYFPEYMQTRLADGTRAPIAVLYSGNLYRPNGDVLQAPYGTKNLRADKRTEIGTLLPAAIETAESLRGNGDTPTPHHDEPDAPRPSSGNLESAFVDAIATTVAGGIAEIVKADVAAHVVDVLGYSPARVEIKTPRATVEIEGITHPSFERVAALLLAGENVYMWGEAGSGKSTIAEQIKESLGLEFVFHNAVTDVYAQLLGARYLDGEFVPMPLYNAWKHGESLVFFDELDASIPEAFTFLQNALSNGYIVFPNGELVYRHETCYVLGAGNTPLTGADSLYIGRYPQDKAMIDRFVYQYIAYDRRIETALAGGDESLIEFTYALRAALKECGTQAIVTPRGIGRVHRFTDSDEPMMSDADALESAMTKDLGKDDLTVLRSKMSGAGRWYDAFDALTANAR